MARQFTLEYWEDNKYFVGRIKEVPGGFSQGETLTKLAENVNDAYRMVIEDEGQTPLSVGEIKRVGPGVVNRRQFVR